MVLQDWTARLSAIWTGASLARFGCASRCLFEKFFASKKGEIRVFLAQLFRAAGFPVDNTEHGSYTQTGVFDNFQRFQRGFAFRANVVNDDHVANLFEVDALDLFFKSVRFGLLAD